MIIPTAIRNVSKKEVEILIAFHNKQCKKLQMPELLYVLYLQASAKFN
jgi:hypothetical protein